MEKSIETIWKEGFLKKEALIAPKVNDLYNRKSIDVVDKFKRMYKMNIIAILVFALIFLPVSIAVNIPYMGIPMTFLFLTIVFFGVKFKKKLNKIDKSLNSYQYIKTFDNWTKDMIMFNTRLSRFLYPYVFLSLVAGFWFGGFGGNIPGQYVVDRLLVDYPNTVLVFGIPLFVILGLMFGVAFFAYFGGRIGKWDINIGYGRILKRLDTLLIDMEELRASN